ncbi:uncharacterized protein A4U43_C02F1520 [Asparagus officinalis]|uniref:Uncharacterized protein n=1 Tax=Asparagus officinalis TaxID=4686 RepID=A0A5P1FFV6_ASPOF|nr:uncharacterized protein A4U43_C02F1520 [Asparagus officinalis]
MPPFGSGREAPRGARATEGPTERARGGAEHLRIEPASPTTGRGEPTRRHRRHRGHEVARPPTHLGAVAYYLGLTSEAEPTHVGESIAATSAGAELLSALARTASRSGGPIRHGRGRPWCPWGCYSDRCIGYSSTVACGVDLTGLMVGQPDFLMLAVKPAWEVEVRQSGLTRGEGRADHFSHQFPG